MSHKAQRRIKGIVDKRVVGYAYAICSMPSGHGGGGPRIAMRSQATATREQQDAAPGLANMALLRKTLEKSLLFYC
jgi:hypothetical protein